MSDLNLSRDARRRLWRCYSLIFRPKGDAEKNVIADLQLHKSHKHTGDVEENELLGDATETEISHVVEDDKLSKAKF